MTRAEAIAEAIKNTESLLRVQGRAISWERFNSQFNSGYFSEQVLVPMAVENSAADKNSLTPEPESGIL
jgi:hypothetical protein